MKTVKYLLYLIFGFLAIILIIAFFVSKDFHFEKSVTINKPIEQVWQHTNSLSALDKWSPWAAYDQNVKKQILGKDGTVGAKATWDSEVEKVGKGSQTITKIEVPTLLATKLVFIKPYENEVDGFVKLKSDGQKTIVSWGIDSKMPYPYNIMNLILDTEENIGKDFTSGLNKLKIICEKE